MSRWSKSTVACCEAVEVMTSTDVSRIDSALNAELGLGMKD